MNPRLFLFTLLSFLTLTTYAQECDPDTEPPTMYCLNGLTVDFETPDFILSIWATDFNSGTIDNCAADEELSFRIQKEADFDGNVPLTEKLDIATGNPDMIPVVIWCGDLSGNWSYCYSYLNIPCEVDAVAPVAVCNADLNLNASDTQIEVNVAQIDEGSYDNCSDLDYGLALIENYDASNPPTAQSLTLSNGASEYTVVLSVMDASGNETACWTTVAVNWMDCENDEITPVAICEDQIVATVTEDNEYVVSVSDLDQGSYDACSGVSLSVEELSVLDLENLPTATSVTLTDQYPIYQVVLVVQDEAGNVDYCVTPVNINWDGCDGDETSPVAICMDNLNFSSTETEIVITPGQIDEGSNDNCSEVTFGLSFGADYDSSNPPTAQSLTLTDDLSDYIVVLSVQDSNGNENACWATVNVDWSGCENDEITPIAICEEQINVTVSSDNEYVVSVSDVDEGSYDACSDVTLSVEELSVFDVDNPPSTTSVTLTDEFSIYQVVLIVEDEAGNENYCVTAVNIDWGCEEDASAPNLTCLQALSFNNEDNLPDVEIWAIDMIDTAFDNCTPDESLQYRIELATYFDENEVPLDESLQLGEFEPGAYPVVIWVGDQAGNWNFCASVLLYNTAPTILNVDGTVFADTSGNCILEAEEEGIGNRLVYLKNLSNNEIQFATTDDEGFYQFSDTVYNTTDTLFEVGVVNTSNTALGCAMTYEIQLDAGETTSLNHDFAFQFSQADPYCALLSVDIGSEALRHCFNNQYYVTYCNNSLAEVEDAFIEVTLDELMNYTGSSIDYSSVEGNVYRFELGLLEPLECGSFTIDAFLSCEAENGQTHCTEAHIFPEEDCEEAIEEWNGAIVEVSGICDEEGVHLIIENVGAADMLVPRSYIVVEDVVMYSEDDFQLDVGEQEVMDFPANGATWRLEAEQVVGYQGYSMNIVAVEGCGGINVPGIVNMFEMNDEVQYVSIDCQQNVSSFDPNDKQAFPTGYGEENFIKANTEIEYQIRFQNTGTAPAFQVVLYDTLSPWLNPETVKTGSASHPYRVELLDGNVLKFSFDDIILPDSTSNEPESHGFVKFKIEQQADNPDGTVILNQAGIYFDANPVVLTNTVKHTIGSHFITVSTQDEHMPGVAVKVLPNPFSEKATIQLRDYEAKDGIFTLFNSWGQQIMEFDFNGNRIELVNPGLPTGMYMYQIFDGGQLINSGKVVIE